MDKPFIHFIKQNKDIFLFDVNTNMISKINQRIYEFLSLHREVATLNEADRFILENMKKIGRSVV